MCPRPLQVDLLALKVVSESRVTWATSVPISVFLGLSVLDLGPMYIIVHDRQTDVVRRASSLNVSALSGWRHNKLPSFLFDSVNKLWVPKALFQEGFFDMNNEWTYSALDVLIILHCRCLLSQNYVRVGKWFVQPHRDESEQSSRRYCVYVCIYIRGSFNK